MKKHLFIKLLSVLLCFSMLVVGLPLYAFAQEVTAETSELYIKSVKLSRGSKDKAKQELENEGYIFLDSNLNAGTGEDGIYLGYTTTTDVTQAVYDLKVMNMKGGFTLTSMEKAIESQKTVFAEMATDLQYLIDEFIDAYKQNTVPAQKAYKALNFFRVTENETENEQDYFGYQLVNGNYSTERLTELILFCDVNLVESIIKILTMGIQGRNENWLTRLSALGPYSSNGYYGDDETELKRRAEALLPIFQIYAQTYNAMESTGIVSGQFNDQFEIEGAEYKYDYTLEAEDSQLKNLDITRYKSYKLAFDQLEKYTYGEGTLKDFFKSLETASNPKALYPLVSIITDGEYSALSYGCVLEIILGAEVLDTDFVQYDEVFDRATQEVKSVYLYGGVDKIALEGDTVIAFTEEANRHMAATGELEFYENETQAENTWETGKQVATIVAGLGMAVIALANVSIGITMLATCTWSIAGVTSLAGRLGTFMKLCVSASGTVATLVVVAIAATVALAFYIVSVIEESINDRIKWDENPIPEYIYDIKEVGIRQTSENENVAATYIKAPTYVLYEAVTNVSGKVIDLNARSGDAYQWISLYASYEAAGEDAKPIKADMLVNYGDGQTPKGYVPLTVFGENIAYDLNLWDDKNSVNGIYVFYKQDIEANVEDGLTFYVSDVYLQSGESTAHCIRLLEAAGYTPINVNLSPSYEEEGWFSGKSIYSYVGYKITTNKSNALRDIRISYDTNMSPFNYGGATYAECGSSAGVTLYASKYTSTGTPILAGGLIVTTDRDDAPAGYEPVNLFSGGPAMSFNTYYAATYFGKKTYYLYYLPETTFAEGESYIGGISYLSADLNEFEKFANDYKDEIKTTLSQELGLNYTLSTKKEKQEASCKYILHEMGFQGYIKRPDHSLNSFVYTTTHNPYRAIYGIKGTKVSGIPNVLIYEAQGYVSSVILDFYTYPYGTYNSLESSITYLEPHFTINDTEWNGHTELNGMLFLSGNVSGNVYNSTTGEMSKAQPIKESQLIISATDIAETAPADDIGFTPIGDVYDSDVKELVITDKIGKYGYKFYLSADEAEAMPYVSKIYTLDTLGLFRSYGADETGVTSDAITRGMVLSAMGNKGATYFCSQTFQMDGWHENEVTDNHRLSTLYFAYSRTDKKTAALRDMFLYYNGLSSEAPPSYIYKGSVKYSLICDINYNFTANDESIAPGIYLYGTTDSRAGEKIIDFTVSSNPFKSGYETVRTYNGRSLIGEVVDALNADLENQPMGKGRDVIKKWITFFTPANDGRDALHPYYYLHFKREGENIEQQKPYISKLHIAKNYDNKSGVLDRLFDEGAEGYLNKNLNAGTIGDTIYLGYRRTADPAEAITDIRAFHKDDPTETKTDENGIVYQRVSKKDLNDGCMFWSDYIYMYSTKDPAAGAPITEIAASDKTKTQAVTKTDENGNQQTVAEITTVKKWNSNSYSDFNEDAGGDYIYLLVTRPTEKTMGSYEAPNYGKDKTYNRTGSESSAEGEYIGALYVMDKNTLRQEMLANGVASDKCNCEDISDSLVFERLTKMGATEIIETPILVSTSDYGKNNKNKVFIGISRTDNERKAIKDITLNVQLLSSDSPAETIYVNKTSYKIVAESAAAVPTLPAAINLISLEDAQNALTPRVYLYTTTSGSEPIYDICINNTPILNGWGTALSQNQKDAFYDLYGLAKTAHKNIQDGMEMGGGFFSNNYTHWDFIGNPMSEWASKLKSLFNPNDIKLQPFYIHYNKYQGSITDTKPYIGAVYIAYGDSKQESLAKLLENSPDGFIEVNLNQSAGGKKIYLAYKRVDNQTAKNKAITDIAVYQGDTPINSQILNINGVSIRYTLVSDIDLNKDTDGKKLYMYATTDVKAGGPVTDLYINSSPVNKNHESLTERTVKRLNNGSITNENMDLNKDADGDYLYLVLKQELAAGQTASNTSASLIGTGSLTAILCFVAATIIVLLIIKKHKQKSKTAR